MKILFASMLSVFGLLGVFSPNNYTAEVKEEKGMTLKEDKGEDIPSKKYTYKEVDSLIRTQLIGPLSNCYFGEHRHMTKCPEFVDYEFTGKSRLKKQNTEDVVFYGYERLNAYVYLDLCNNVNPIAHFELDLSREEITVKESFSAPRIKHDKFIKQFCGALK